METTATRVLAIDTSSPTARWVGVENGDVIEPVEVEAGKHHDALLAQGVGEWLERHGWLGETPLAGVAVVTGPGGYTGLRVGVAFATALAAARGLKVLPLSSYDALAARAPGQLVWALMPIRKGVCRGRFLRGGDRPQALTEPTEVPMQALGEYFADLSLADDGPILPLGEGYARYKAEVEAVLGTRLQVDPTVLRPAAESLGILTAQLWPESQPLPPAEIDVAYGAPFQPTPKK